MANHIKRCEQCRSTTNKFRHPASRVCEHCTILNSYVRRGMIREPDYPETTTEHYKEPMVPVEGGYGYIGAITETKDGEHVQCHICGYFFGRLGSHVKAHKITPREYKMKFGLRIDDGLLSPVRKKAAQGTFNKTARGTEALAKATRASKEKWHKEPWKVPHAPWTAEMRNLKGMCKEQTIVKIQSLAKRNNGIARQEDFVAEWGSAGSVYYWFENWANAVRAAGLETYYARARRLFRKRTDDALVAMRDFYVRTAQTPQRADFKAENNLPSYKTMVKRFGTLNNARTAAGVPLLIKLPGRRGYAQDDSEEAIKWLAKA